MKRIIDGKLYDIATAKVVCVLPCSVESQSDFEWHSTSLYRSPAGAFFLAGRGGARSMWAEGVGENGSSGGSGLHLVTEEEAKEYAEAAWLDPDAYQDFFGAVAIG